MPITPFPSILLNVMFLRIKLVYAKPLFWGPLLLVAGLLNNCGDVPENIKYASPASTYKTYRRAIDSNEANSAWDCLAVTYQRSSFGGELMQWKEQWPKKQLALQHDLSRREIIEEREINDRIAYLLFDTKLTKKERPTPPYFYFLREKNGWKITSYLDSTFHQELERAIEKGEYSVPH